MPVLASRVAEPAVNSGVRQSADNTGSAISLTDAATALPAGFFDDVADVPVLAQALKPSRETGWRVERFGPVGPDGKGRYLQWRRGSGKKRVSAYGGKVIF